MLGYWKSVWRRYSLRMTVPARPSPRVPDAERLNVRGWCRFPIDSVLAHWIDASRKAIDDSIRAPENAHWLRYGGTWFAGVNVLPNDGAGCVPGGPPLAGDAVAFIRTVLGHTDLVWDRAQVSVCHPGYPQPMAGESDAIFAFRRDFDAAHIDGLLKDGPARRRYLREHHAFILGIPISRHDEGAAPFTIWEGSHHIIGDWLRLRLKERTPQAWGAVDLTDEYQAVRRDVFARCRRIAIHARPGEAYLVHRHALHGMARWDDGATAEPGGRIIVYFRPPQMDLRSWLQDP